MQFHSWGLLSVNIFIFLLICNFTPPWCGLLSSPQISVFFSPPVSRSHAHRLKAAGSAITPQMLSLHCLPWQIMLQIVKWRCWPLFRHLLWCNDSWAFAADANWKYSWNKGISILKDGLKWPNEWLCSCQTWEWLMCCSLLFSCHHQYKVTQKPDAVHNATWRGASFSNFFSVEMF